MIRASRLFVLAYAIYFIGSLLFVTAIPYSSMIRQACMIVSFLMLSILIIRNIIVSANVKRNSFFALMIIITLYLLSVASKDFFLLMLGTMALSINCLSDKDIQKIFIISLRITIIVSLITVVGCVLKLVPNVDTPRGWGEPSRLAWGFGHSQVPTLLFFYSVLYYYCIKERVKTVEVIFFCIFAIVMGKIFDARNAMYSVFIFFLLIFLYCITRKLGIGKKGRVIYFFSSFVPLIMTAFTFLTIYLYDKGNSLIVILDRLLSSRIRLSSMNIQTIPIKLLNFVSYAEYESSLAITVDNGYLYFVLRYGVLFIPLLFVMFYSATNMLKNKKRQISCVALISAGVSAFVSNAFTGCYFLPFWVMALHQISKRIERKRESNKSTESAILQV